MSSLPNGQTRRQFVTRFAFATVASAAAGRAWNDLILMEASAAAAATPGILQISLTEFPALQSDRGSIRIGVNPIASDHFPDGSFYPILINRVAAGKFFVLNSECRHASCVVAAYDDLEGGLRCPCHLSLYGFDGSVIQGPASRPLLPFAFTYDGGDLLTIKVPGLNFKATPKRIDLAAKSRLRLTFPTLNNVNYEVRFRGKLSDPWAVVPFAISNTGPADQTSLLGDELPADVFVDRVGDSGFYEVAIQVLDLT